MAVIYYVVFYTIYSYIARGKKGVKDFYKNIASKDYQALSEINKKTFQNIVNLNLNFALNFN